MNKKREQKLGKFIALILRHNPGLIGIELDEHGWADCKALCKNEVEPLTMAELVQIVENDNKGRYSFSAHNAKIRANQGHSVKVDVELKDYIPTTVLYHGTDKRNVGAIMDKGLIPMSRLHVHLSLDKETALNVASRHGSQPVLFEVDTEKMLADNHKFFISENGVILISAVPAKYLFVLE